MYDGWEMLWNVLNTKHKISQCVEYCFEKNEQIRPNIHIYHSIDAAACGV